jgi:predicted HTH transcriptional regulator
MRRSRALNPFDKHVDELKAADLQKLLEQSVAEGYYVEYKGDTFPGNPKIGHSVASFANTYGGWYIIGVKTDTHNVANDICGFDLTAYPDPISKVREIAKSHIDPVPIFYPRVIEIGSNRAVLVVQIPSEQETPFISKDGRIYRRLHDSSDPVAESNRYAVDRLVEEGRKSADRFSEICMRRTDPN